MSVILWIVVVSCYEFASHAYSSFLKVFGIFDIMLSMC